jgi:predicted Zn finger-like uncharacterized protein
MSWFAISSARNPLNAELGAGIARHGFRKWYERELLSGHAHMVLCFLAVLAMIGALEAFREASLGGKLLDVALMLASGAIAFWALRRYLFLLTRAEHIANQANCPQCGSYGLLRSESSTPRHTRVRCKQCDHAWDIELG